MRKVIPILVLSSIIFANCKKQDNEAPVITLKGASTIQVSLQGVFLDPGATATDNKDQVVQVSTQGIVNVNLKGNYTIIYTATDEAGNTGSAKRIVTVKNDIDNMAGTYTCVITSGPGSPKTYTQTIAASQTINNQIQFGKFRDLENNINVIANITATTLTIPQFTTGLVGPSPGKIRTYQNGTGTTNANGFNLSYTEIVQGAPAPDYYTEIFTKN